MARYTENVLNIITLLEKEIIKGKTDTQRLIDSTRQSNDIDMERLFKETDLNKKFESSCKENLVNSEFNGQKDFSKDFDRSKDKIREKLEEISSVEGFISFKDEKFPLIISQSEESPKSTPKEHGQLSLNFDEPQENNKKQDKIEISSKLEKDLPLILAYKGDLNLLAKKNFRVAVIGLLNPEKDIQKLEKDIVAQFRDKDAIIISGLALGCDTIAHETAFKEATVAILPSTLEDILPKENEGLAKDIANNGGLLISEYYEKAKDQWKFIGRYIDRDRLQAMFSDIVILTASYTEKDSKGDSKKDSGSRHAMNKAKEYGIKRGIVFDEKLWFDDSTQSQFRLNKYLLLERFKDIDSNDDELKNNNTLTQIKEKIKQEKNKQETEEKMHKLIDEISKEEYLKIVGLIKNSKKIEDFFIVERDCQELIEELKNKKD
ncbi:DNA-processing protein DprA [Campylobacter cuniculorum]|uniref:DNA-processing protein DprA n=1 Tax=Campylobacter cuniculorum TaxID=374106 RepID=UPI0023F24916|nr:DNA-processing protein DprA [Campylobacter cuniculorum]